MAHEPPFSFVTSSSDILTSYSEDGGGVPLTPDFLARPKSKEEIVELVNWARDNKVSLTPTGQRTCDTGSGLTDSGILVSLEKQKQILEINESEQYAEVEPGILLFDFKQALEEKGFFYPPDPSSEKIASLGGTISTNAAGARSYKYGQTVNHILGLEVITASGKAIWFNNYQGAKNATGPSSLHSLANLIVGAEGIFGIISKVRVKIYKGVPEALAICAFFEKEKDMHDLNVKLSKFELKNVSPRSMEFLDKSCLRFIKDTGTFSNVPENADSAIIFEEELARKNKDEILENWLQILEQQNALVNDTIVADTPSKISNLRELRHTVPAGTWEMGKNAQKSGGKKISTDWAVPVSKLEKVLNDSRKLAKDFGFSEERVFAYAHLGSGHPHLNFIPKNPEELEKALLLRKEMSKLALKAGGTVAGEHGIGKFRKDLFKLEETNSELAQKTRLIKALKKELDQEAIFGPGNLIND